MSKIKFFVLPLLVVLLFGAYPAAQANTVKAIQHRTIVGSWIVNGTFDPQTGLPPFVNIATFTASGNVINVDPHDGASVGEWRKTGNGQYSVTFRGFTVIDGQSLPLRVRGKTLLSADGVKFEGPFVTDIYDGNGNIMFTVTGTVRAVRFRIEKL